ncbi:PREDICTED: uncharacterized protein LOC105154924 [Acromyrmex echinatior]|uniref:uncharacterized protein LOC105154924 n=1 Tax=Acromyrmex echinatior TaxID=103372 RepID=UPI000580CB37|nr:PREDICTED: uncharacterized protein LOC105154924 [Acromyrmex echinatior]
MAQQQPEGIVQFYKESGLDAKGNQLVTCGRCRQKSEPDFIIDRVRMKCHIYNEHGESEIMDDPKYQSVAARFNLHRQNANQIDVGECLVSNCNTKIKSKFGKGLPFKNHSITHHTDDKKTAFFAKAVKIDSGRKILNNYKIKNTEYAKCSFCRTLISLEGLDSHPAVILVALNRHLIPHIDDYSDILEKKVQDLQFLDEASIQSELEKEEKMQLEINKAKQNVDKEVKMKEIERKTKTEAASEDLNTLLQQYNMKITKCIKIGKYKLHCNIDSNHRYTYDANKLYCIRNHWEIHHGPKNMIYNEIKNDGNVIFRNYKITDGTLATCSKCEYSENMEKDNKLYLDGLKIIRDHWIQNHGSTSGRPKTDENLQTKIQELKMRSCNADITYIGEI